MTRFGKIYLSIIIIFLIALTGFLFYFDSWISDYNETLPETVSEKYFTSLFLTPDTDEILKCSAINPNEFETEDDVCAFIEKSIGTSPSFSKSAVGENEIIYTVSGESDSIATFTLEKLDGRWQPSGMKLLISPQYSVHVKSLASSTVFINGKAVSKDYITKTEPHESSPYLPEWVKGESYVTYFVSGFTKEPSVTIKDRNSASPSLIPVDGILCERIIYDTPDETLSARIIDTAINVELHKKRLAPISLASAYVEENTDFYLELLERDAKVKSKKYEINNLAVSEYFVYDENTLSFRVAFTLITEDGEEKSDVTYFARKINGEYFIYTYKNNSEAIASESFLLEK